MIEYSYVNVSVGQVVIWVGIIGALTPSKSRVRRLCRN